MELKDLSIYSIFFLPKLKTCASFVFSESSFLLSVKPILYQNIKDKISIESVAAVFAVMH